MIEEEIEIIIKVEITIKIEITAIITTMNIQEEEIIMTIQEEEETISLEDIVNRFIIDWLSCVIFLLNLYEEAMEMRGTLFLLF